VGAFAFVQQDREGEAAFGTSQDRQEPGYFDRMSFGEDASKILARVPVEELPNQRDRNP
jgi:hypothetical protein